MSTGCGEARRPPDNTKLFISCLQRRGGEPITKPAQLRMYPSTHIERVASLTSPSVAYDSIDAARTRYGSARRALVFVEDVDGDALASSTPDELLREARRGQAPALALLLMPPAKDPEAQIGRCEDLATRGHDYYD